MKTSHTFTFSVLAALLVACGDDPNSLLGASGGTDPNAPPTTPTDPPKPIDPTDPALCSGREYVGFGAKHLETGRAVAKLGVDRGRLKPFAALQTEYPRVLGNTPAS